MDDEPDMRFLLRLVLESEGHEVVEAADALAALEAIEREALDLLLLDIRIPPFDGWEVLRQVREQYDQNGLPVVMVSAHSSETTLKRARESGSNAYLIKPFTRDELAAVVRKFAGQS